MGLGAIVQTDEPISEQVQTTSAAPEVALKRSFPGLGRIAEATQQFEDVLRDFVTLIQAGGQSKPLPPQLACTDAALPLIEDGHHVGVRKRLQQP